MTSGAIRPFVDGDGAAGFHSGVHALDDFLVRHAATNERRGICRVYVRERAPEDPPDLPAVVGFYTLSMADVEADEVVSVLGSRLPRYPMPVALIGRLAVDERARGRRVGEALLVDALRRVLDAAGVVGCVGVVVDAKDERAEAFYARYDFQPLRAGPRPRRMFISVAQVRASFDDLRTE